MSRCLVTGGAGFIGSHLVDALVEAGEEVVVIDNFSSGNYQNLAGVRGQIELVEGDICHYDLVKSAMKGVQVVFHLAAEISVPYSLDHPWEVMTVNVGGLGAVLEAARQEGVRRFIFSSSSAVYGNQVVERQREDMIPDPLSPYALSKLMGEEYCQLYSRLYGMETVSLRYFNVFGPRQFRHSHYAAVIPQFIGQLLSGEQPTIHGSGQQQRDFTFVQNVVDANMAACRRPEVIGECVCNVGSGSSVSIYTLLEVLCARMQVTFSPQYKPARDNDLRVSEADVGRFQEEFNWYPQVSFEEGLDLTIAWNKELVVEKAQL